MTTATPIRMGGNLLYPLTGPQAEGPPASLAGTGDREWADLCAPPITDRHRLQRITRRHPPMYIPKHLFKGDDPGAYLITWLALIAAAAWPFMIWHGAAEVCWLLFLLTAGIVITRIRDNPAAKAKADDDQAAR